MRTIRVLCVLLSVASVGCDASLTPRPGDDGGGDGEMRDGGPTGGVCDPAAPDCPAGQRCSAASVCIPEGTCRLDADCAGATTCGAGSRECLGEGACRAEGDCPDGQTCDLATETCEIGGECGTSEFEITRLAPNVMILLDRSGSMDNDVDGRTRWAVAKEAITTVTGAFGAEIRFGLATYSSCTGDGCSAGSVVVPVGDDASRIDAFLAPLRGEGSSDGTPPRYLCDSGDPETSTGPSLAALTGEPSLQDPDRRNAVLLVTDGEESDCGGPNGAEGAAMLQALPIPVRTYAVGFSTDASASQLNAVAMAGGTMRYYPADDAAALLGALERIADEVASCEYRVDAPPPDPSMLFVYFDDDPAGVSEDASDGWTFDATSGTLTFHGSACTQIRSGAVSDIDVVYGCPGPVLD
ncbi:MAG TPA: VWA domain-containing protein [Sandaracinaceae bacterium LLY-WYZ-13_1]|nr:VWA domain-containing protein [Sandaracinaceae bacterium LLY-WYZ-13_1]